MKKWMPGIRRYTHGMIIVILLFLSVFERVYFERVRKDRAVRSLDTNKVARPYRTITVQDSGNHLVAYEFHKRDADGLRYLDCSAIINSIDPAKDDYKMYCRSVIEDIERTTGTDRVEVAIYDDYEAYELSEVKSGQQFKILNESETDSVNKHTVATYYGKMEEFEGSLTLRFYPEAKNRYTEKEIYEP